MGGSSRISTPCLFFKFLLGVVVFSWFLVFGFLESGGRKIMTTTVVVATTSQDAKHMEILGREKLGSPELDLNYMSKRRVPNGPDPIHNRRAGKSRQPPGQA